jgi:DNA polymerase elongation subunit (family B)
METEKRWQFLHAVTVTPRSKDRETVVAVLKDVDSGKIKLEYFYNPQRSVYIVKPGLRSDQNIKPLYRPVSDFDVYITPNYELNALLKRVLKGDSYNGYVSVMDLTNNVNVFGIDLKIAVLIKQQYYNRYNALATKYRTGGLDIETSVVETSMFASSIQENSIIIMNYVTPEMKVYSGVMRPFFNKNFTEDQIRECMLREFPLFRERLNAAGRKIYDAHPPELHLEFFDNELDLIRWNLSMVHQDKPEYVSIWNLDYDIPVIMGRVEALGGNLREIFCHPDIPRDLRYVTYRPDHNPNLQHTSHAWHVFQATGYTWFLDGMCLYSRLRKHFGVEDSYSLDAIANRFFGTGKLTYDKASHYVMQTTRQAEYCAYGAVDAMLNVMLEHHNNDISQLHTLAAYSDIATFNQQTIMLRDRFFDHCKQNGLVPASQMGKLLQPGDEEILNVGGNVLEPGLAWRTGVNKIQELQDVVPDAISKVQCVTADIDVTLTLK